MFAPVPLIAYNRTMTNDCIIMAGGSGTRLWPASNSKKPKQFLPFSSNESFFDSAMERALAISGESEDGRVIIIAGKSHIPPIIDSCSRLEEDKRKRCLLIPEPAAKSTAPAIACAVSYAGLVLGKDRNMLVLTSDHIIRPAGLFYADAARALSFAARGNLVVFGIPPGGPETGYGYIEAAEPLSLPEHPPLDRAAPGGRVYRAASFREKPDREQAEKYLAAGGFYWNSGMFAFSLPFILEEFKRSAPDLLRPFESLKAPQEASYRIEGGLRILAEWPGLARAYGEAPPISFDYAIAEKCGRTVMAAANFDWIDVGSWDEYAKLKTGAPSEVYASDSPGCFVDADIPVALCGVEDLIIAVRSGRDGAPPAVLVAKRGKTQGVKEIVAQIKATGRTELL
ncbi:MAG: mannose-1-phosphate guanylyltransferase [Treponema sp.]|jgi:mannose-1-phosphate guanylyltransferase/mannose-1-phosphate guanylyltransferase/mannose-6-phosphate isomerase|nr:mannose-1-phosphate guanylyltransferase [Treponema sp.]